MSSLVKFSRLSQRNITTTCTLQRLKAEWRLDRKPAYTKLSSQTVVEERKAFGGGKKYKAVTVSHGNYSLDSQNIDPSPLKILDVVHSKAGENLLKEKIIVKGTLLLVDVEPIKEKVSVENLLTDNNKEGVFYEHIRKLVENGQWYARVTSAPGQVGNCDGVLLDGEELEDWLHEYLMKTDDNLAHS